MKLMIPNYCDLAATSFHSISGMGTKILFTTNPLTSTPNNNSLSVNIPLDEREDYFRNKGEKEDSRAILIDTMNPMLEHHNIESIKKTMLMHEHMFKQQVRELHRLYRVQKILMDEMRNDIKQVRHWLPMTHNPSSRERSCTDIFDLQMPARENNSNRVEFVEEDEAALSTHGAMKGRDDESDVELTLGIGGCARSNASMGNSSARFGRENKQLPHWLFKGLSLNRTSK